MMTEKCFHCGKEVTIAQCSAGLAVKTIHGLYAHAGCIDSLGEESTMTDQTQHILGAADSAHQGIELARSLLQEGLGNMGEILTQGCESLGTASLGSTMRLGQELKEFSFLLDDLLKDAHGLCVLLGKDMGVCEDEPKTLADMVGEPLGTPDYRDLLFAADDPDLGPGEDEAGALPEYLDGIDWGDPEPGEDEFDDDELPF